MAKHPMSGGHEPKHQTALQEKIHKHLHELKHGMNVKGTKHPWASRAQAIAAAYAETKSK